MTLVNMFGNKIPAAGGGGASVSLLLHCDGADAGTSFPDSSINNHSMTVNSSTTVTAIKKFGTASGDLPLSVGSLVAPEHDTLKFGTGDFSMDAWLYQDNAGSTYPFGCGYSTTNDWHFEFFNADMYFRHDGAYIISAVASGAAANTWTHYEVSRTSGTLRIFVGGVQKASVASTADYTPSANATFAVGRNDAGQNKGKFHVDEVRVQKGGGGHTAGFTPETGPY